MATNRYKAMAVALCCCGGSVFSQTLAQAKKWFADGEFEKAKPVFARLVKQAPSNAGYNFWYGACCYETGELHKSLPYLEKSAKRKYIDGYLYVSKAYCDLYRFDEAIGNLEEHIYWLEQKKRDTSAANRLMEKCRTGARMLRGVENVTVIDSFVTDKSALAEAYKLSKASGTIDMLDGGAGTRFTNEWGDRTFFPQTAPDGTSRLYSRAKLTDKWSAPEALKGTEQEGCSQNYPFMNSDGVTLYFASEGPESMGGYDIFITRYDPEDGSYLKPDNMGFPFNSPYNDYLYAIDDLNQLGWFASDRYQPEGKVCVYVFVPNGSKTVYDYESTEPGRLRRLAMLSCIKDTWTDPAKLREGKQRLAQAAYGRQQEREQEDFEFVVNDRSVCRKLEDFRSARAKRLFLTLRQKEKDLGALEQWLESARGSYAKAASAAERERLAPGILDKEKRVSELYAEIDRLTLQVRKEELSAIQR